MLLLTCDGDLLQSCNNAKTTWSLHTLTIKGQANYSSSWREWSSKVMHHSTLNLPNFAFYAQSHLHTITFTQPSLTTSFNTCTFFRLKDISQSRSPVEARPRIFPAGIRSLDINFSSDHVSTFREQSGGAPPTSPGLHCPNSLPEQPPPSAESAQAPRYP